MKTKPSNSKPSSLTNPSEKRKPPLAATVELQKKKKKKKSKKNRRDDGAHVDGLSGEALPVSTSEQLRFFLDQYQSANGVQLSSLELESVSDSCILGLSQCSDHVTETVGEDVKVAFGPTWKEALCENQLSEGKIDAGSPAILVIAASALRSIELLKGFRSLAGECPVVKLFSKHMKVEEQVSLLKRRVNIASGTPSRIKKLIEMEALGLSRLGVIVVDVRPDVKGYSLLTLPQVRDEFWDLYRNYFHHQLLLRGRTRLALYGSLPNKIVWQGKKKP